MMEHDRLTKVVKNKLSPQSGSVALRQWNPIHKKGGGELEVFFKPYLTK